MTNAFHFSTMFGCISAGKEANVYHGHADHRSPHYALLAAHEYPLNESKVTVADSTQAPADLEPASDSDDDSNEPHVHFAADVTDHSEAAASPVPSSSAEINAVCDVAVKIYKTSILVFKDRDRYVTGEHRFRRGYCKRLALY